MTTTITTPEASVANTGTSASAASTPVAPVDQNQAARLSSEQVWRALAKASFAVISYVTPAGAPRSSGVVYTIVGRRMYVAVAPTSWKARQIAVRGQVSVTVPVRRGGILALLLPIPPATISFRGTATVYPAGSTANGALMEARARLDPMMPPERRAVATIIEITPEGRFLTFGVGIPLMQMRNPAAASARVPVS